MEIHRPSVPLLRSLEGLRFIASLGIVAIHMLPHYGAEVPHGLNLFVDMFFVISGVVIGHAYVDRITGLRSYAGFVQRRVARIYPLHVATLIFYVIVGFGIVHFHLVDDVARFDSTQIIPNLLLIHAWGAGKLSFNFVSWSISAEFLLYLLFPVIAWLVSRHMVRGLVVVIGLASAAVFWSEFIYGAGLTDLHWDYGSVRALPSFAFGVWLSAFGTRIVAPNHARWSTLLFPILAIATAAEIAVGLSNYLLLATLWLLVATGFFSDLQERSTFAAWSPLSGRGYLTYSLYMLHLPVTTVFVSFLFPRILGHSVIAQGISLTAAVAILFLLSIASFRYFEDPLRRWLR